MTVPMINRTSDVAANAAIRIRDLSFSVNNARRSTRRTDILAGISLTVANQEFVSIVGPSGCGKSTLLNFLAGLLPIETGTVDIAPSSDNPDQKVTLGYMFQQHGLLPWRSVIKNVELGLEVASINSKERKIRANSLLEDMGLKGFEQHYPKELSGGMCQRVSLARTLATNPDIILMDEPFGALDAQTRIFIQEMFSNYWEKHRKTILLVTHDLEEAIFLSDRILVMSARPGKIISEYHVDIERPRDFSVLRKEPRFIELLDDIWADIKNESFVSMQGNIS